MQQIDTRSQAEVAETKSDYKWYRRPRFRDEFEGR